MTDILNIQKLSEYEENNRIEAKKAKSAVPDSVWETYSSFANTEGGIILLGVDEREDHSLVVTGVDDVHKVKTDFWNQINNPQKVNVNILLDRMVYEHEVEGKQIVIVEVPRADRTIRPVYIGNNPLGGTFRRNGEGDYRCTKEQVSAMLRDSSEITQDRRVIQEMDNSVFCPQTVKDYRDRFRNFHSTHIWNNDDDEIFLRHIGAISLSKEDQRFHPTVAGLLMFGYEYEITREMPQYFLDYREELDPTLRWTHRLVSTSGDWSGNLYDFFFRVYPRLVADLPVPFVLQDGLSRVDVPPTHKAMREFLLNTLAHADHYGRQGIVIRRNLNHIHFANPGDFRVELKSALLGGNSDPRNSVIMKMFGLVDVGDRAGTGMPDAIAVVNRDLGASVEYNVSFEPERTVLEISLREKTSDKLVKQAIKEPGTRDKSGIQGLIEQKTRDKIASIEGISEKTRDKLSLIMKYAEQKEVVRNHEIAELCEVGDDRARVLLMTLVDNKLLKAEGDKKDRRYIFIMNE